MTGAQNLLLATFCVMALAITATQAYAQALADPTRPPPGLASIDQEAKTDEAPPPGLQTIIRRQGEKPAAVINGEYVMLGGRVGDARLVKIGEDSVTLRSSAGTETLKLIPGVEKTATAKAGEADAKTVDGKASGRKALKK